MRNDLLRQAARLLPPPPLSAWQKAHVLAALVERPCSPPGVSTAGGLVALALAVGARGRQDRALSAAQLFRVLTDRQERFSHPGRELQVEEAADFGVMLDNRKRATR